MGKKGESSDDATQDEHVKYRPNIPEINNKLQQQRCGWHTREIKKHLAEITRCAFILKVLINEFVFTTRSMQLCAMGNVGGGAREESVSRGTTLHQRS
jgi:hypothetical protein